MVHGKNCIPYRIGLRLLALQDPTMMIPSHLGCPLSLKTPNMGIFGSVAHPTIPDAVMNYD